MRKQGIRRNSIIKDTHKLEDIEFMDKVTKNAVMAQISRRNKNQSKLSERNEQARTDIEKLRLEMEKTGRKLFTKPRTRRSWIWRSVSGEQDKVAEAATHRSFNSTIWSNLSKWEQQAM